MSTPKKILVVDIEATCYEGRPPNKFPQQRNEIIEIGITPVDIKTHKRNESHAILVKPPTTEINEFCTRLTSITPDLIEREGVDFKVAINRLRTEFKSQRNMWASWGEYDKRSFDKNCQWNGVDYPFSNLHLNVKALFTAQMGYSCGLDKAVADLGLQFEGTHHRGVDDSRNIANVLVWLLGE